MIRYWMLFGSFFRSSLIADFEYRANMLGKVVTDVIWYALQLSLFEVLYRHTTQISGWTMAEVRVFVTTLFLVDAFYMLLFAENLDTISEKVTKGELDLLLAKPVNAQFMVSLMRCNVAYLVNVIVVLFMYGLALVHLPNGVPWLRLPAMVIAVPCGLAIVYSVKLCFASVSLIVTQSDALQNVWFQIYKLGMRPDEMFPTWLRITVLTIVPVGFVASVPARIVTTEAGYKWLFAEILAAGLMLTLARSVWRACLRRYSSASS